MGGIADHNRPGDRPSRMSRQLTWFLALLPFGVALLLWCIQTLPLRDSRWTSRDTRHLWTLAALQHRIVDAPRHWLGHTVRVEGVAISVRSRRDPFTWSEQEFLVDANSSARLPLAHAPENRMLAVLRRLPLIGAWLPPPQALVWDCPAVYQIQLRPRDCVESQNRLCVAATLVEAAPAPL